MQFEIIDLGLVDCKKAWDFQKETFLAVKNGNSASTLILCQHHPVITLGRKSNRSNILADESELNTRQIEICEVDRGGDVTYHGPGQLVAYPVFDLDDIKKDINFFLRFLESVVIQTLADFGIKAEGFPGLTGVWANKKKIASIGIAIRSWISFHGLSINIKANDLVNFSLIRPCGMDIEMTSLETVCGRSLEINQVKQRLIHSFRDTLESTQGTPLALASWVSLT